MLDLFFCVWFKVGSTVSNLHEYTSMVGSKKTISSLHGSNVMWTELYYTRPIFGFNITGYEGHHTVEIPAQSLLFESYQSSRGRYVRGGGCRGCRGRGSPGGRGASPTLYVGLWLTSQNSLGSVWDYNLRLPADPCWRKEESGGWTSTLFYLLGRQITEHLRFLCEPLHLPKSSRSPNTVNPRNQQ